jgi:hypothetical protein
VGSADDGFESWQVSSLAVTSIHSQLNVSALNDGFTALNSMAATSQSGRVATDAVGIVGEFTLSTPSGRWPPAALWVSDLLRL